MPAEAWEKSPPELVERFDEALPAAEGITRKPMFGYPAAFVHGNLCCSLFRDRVVARVGEEEAARLIASRKAEPFAPLPGRPMKAYVLVPAADAARTDRLAPWLARAVAFTRTVPAKAPKAKAKAARKSTPAAKAKASR